jgi:hypothetical protein
MHRLQISLPEWLVEYLRERAARDRVSLAEVIRRLVQREMEMVREEADPESLWSIAGLAEDRTPLIEGVPVSESPELYLTRSQEEGEEESDGRDLAAPRTGKRVPH